MQRAWIGVMALLVLTVSTAIADDAQTKWQVQQTLKFEAEPLDMVTAPRSQRVYILNKKGEILVYAVGGKLKGKINVGADVRRINAGPREDMLYLLSPKNKTLQSITIELTENIDVQGSPFKGPQAAPVTVAVFSDFQCPYCARLVPVFDRVIEQYPRQVKIVFKHFPLRNHAFAVKAAQASIAAHQQGKFWQFHDLLFKHYKQISDKKIEEIRTQLGLSADQFQKDMKAPGTMARIRSDAGNGRDAGVRGTPTVFVNGKLLRNKTLNGFQSAINQALKNANTKVKP